MSSLIMPAAALAALTFLIYATSFVRASLITRRTAAQDDTAREASDWPFAPDWLDRSFRSYNHLRELPLMFYAVVALQLAAGGGDSTQLMLAWAYVVIRIAHAVIYFTANILILRAIMFFASGLVLGAMWVRLVISAL